MHDEPNAHCQTWDLIPWVVNGTATPEQRERVQRHLEHCADCRAEHVLQQQLRAALQADTTTATAAPRSALAELFARIDAEDAAAALSAPPQLPAPARGARWTPWLAAAVLVQAIGLALLGAAQYGRPAPADYRTLSAEAAPARGAIRLVLAPETRLGELRSLLGSVQWRIVESNADNSIFALAPAQGTADPARVAAALAQLRSSAGVLLAEPMVGAAGAAQ